MLKKALCTLFALGVLSGVASADPNPGTMKYDNTYQPGWKDTLVTFTAGSSDTAAFGIAMDELTFKATAACTVWAMGKSGTNDPKIQAGGGGSTGNTQKGRPLFDPHFYVFAAGEKYVWKCPHSIFGYRWKGLATGVGWISATKGEGTRR